MTGNIDSPFSVACHICSMPFCCMLLTHINLSCLLAQQMFQQQAKASAALLAEWPPAGSIGSMGVSPRMAFGTPPFGKSVDMVDVCTQLMEAGGEGLHGLRAIPRALPGQQCGHQCCKLAQLQACTPTIVYCIRPSAASRHLELAVQQSPTCHC